jgi:hypothetical protein
MTKKQNPAQGQEQISVSASPNPNLVLGSLFRNVLNKLDDEALTEFARFSDHAQTQSCNFSLVLGDLANEISNSDPKEYDTFKTCSYLWFASNAIEHIQMLHEIAEDAKFMLKQKGAK